MSRIARAITAAPRRLRGQAMVETLIAASLVLVPLFLAIPMIAKYLDLRSHTVQAARYAAWERSVWFGGAAALPMGLGSGSFSNKWNANEKTDSAIRAEIGARILSNTGETDSFSSSDKSAGSFTGGDKPLWKDRRGNTLLANYSDIVNTVDNGQSPGLINKVLGPVADVAAVVSNFTVETNAKYTGKVTLRVQEFAVNPGGGMSGCPGCTMDFIATGTKLNFSEFNTLVANGWSANGPGSLTDYGTHPERMTAYNQVRGLSPTALLKPPPTNPDGSTNVFSVVLEVLKTISLIFFPELSTLDLGKIEVDKVPPDRLR